MQKPEVPSLAGPKIHLFYIERVRSTERENEGFRLPRRDREKTYIVGNHGSGSHKEQSGKREEFHGYSLFSKKGIPVIKEE